jgi:hypothetical protein
MILRQVLVTKVYATGSVWRFLPLFVNSAQLGHEGLQA